MMNRLVLVLLISSLFFSCTEHKKPELIFKPISLDFPYKFNQEIEEKLANDTVSWKDQIAASDFATKGEYRNSMLQWDKAMGIKVREIDKNKIDSILVKNRIIPAKEFLIEQAKNHEITIINEAHHQPMHRVFTTELLKSFYENGYRYLGLETLDRKDSLLNQRNYPIIDSGWYSQEPQFGDLLREALKIGYILFPYETERMGNTTIEERETDQANNIKAFMDTNNTGKLLLHVGYAHATEGTIKSHGKDQKWMASKLYDLTGINPFTINQEDYTEKSNIENSSPLLQTLKPDKPVVLINKTDSLPFGHEQYKGWMDVSVFHPFTKFINNRPDWIFKNGKQKIEISLNDKIDIEGPLMILAFKKGENISIAIPIDVQEIENKNSRITLALKSGSYQIVVQNLDKEGVIFSYVVD